MVSLIRARCISKPRVMIAWLSPMRARALVRAPRYAQRSLLRAAALLHSGACISACTPQLSGCRLGPIRRGAYGCLQA
jgi:hypothetical protein